MREAYGVLRQGLTRRFFLRAGLVGACACFLPWPTWAKKPDAKAPADSSAKAPAAVPEISFYVVYRERLLADFKGVCNAAHAWLAARTAEPTARAVADDALRRYETLLPGIPDIGGQANRNQPFLTMAGWLTAITQAMGDKGMPAKDAGRLLYDLYAADWSAMPPAKARMMGDALFEPTYFAKLEQWAAESQKRRNPADWVGKAVAGDGKTFDLGYDYSECGAVKYFKAQGVAEVAPYFCLNDFLASRAQGTGLVRTSTIAQGAAVCDFRYKRDRPVTQNWDTEAPKFAGKKPV